jgi:type VI secretion system protein ImpK
MHLADLFTELFEFVTETLAELEVREPSYQQMREEVIRLLAPPRSKEFAVEKVTEARFAVCAWLDEQIARSAWAHKELWLKEQLQRSYFNTTDAGEEFFARLERLEPLQREVREVYYFCLALGFTGKYCNPGDQLYLEQLKHATLRLLIADERELGALDGTAIFPDNLRTAGACPPGSSRRRSFSWMAISCLIGPIALFAVLFVLYRFTLSGVGENFLKTVAN